MKNATTASLIRVIHWSNWLSKLHRKNGTSALVPELNRLEAQAKTMLNTSGKTYDRALVASQARISKETLTAWLAGERTPGDFRNLMRVVEVLANLARQPVPAEPFWHDRWTAARQKPQPKKHRLLRWRNLIPAVVTFIVVAYFTGLFQSLGSDTPGALGKSLNSTPKTKAAPALHAVASWCCKYATVQAHAGFYWSGSVTALDHDLASASNGFNFLSLTPAGADSIEIELSASRSDSIYVAPPKVLVRDRRKNVKTGIVAVVPLYPQGSSEPGEFSTDVDDPDPQTSTDGTGSGQYYYVSKSSPQMFILNVTDTDYDCSFDIELTWQDNGKTDTETLINNGHHFRILGSTGLAWYNGDPAVGTPLIRVTGKPFSHYAP